MGLAELGAFDTDKKVIEYAIARQDTLSNMTVTAFCDLLSTDAPAPGGGSVAALCTAMSGALTAMVANLTVDKKGYEKVQESVRLLAEKAQPVKEKALDAINRDTDAFYEMMDAMRLPKKTEAEIALRTAKMEETTQKAILVPFETLELSLSAVSLAQQVAAVGNTNALSDAGVAALTALTGAKAAYYNILINLAGVSTQSFKDEILDKSARLIAQIEAIAKEVEDTILGKLR
jgi:glutamate formiminotransferase/formiminotetrahydrofolate cyclodeaminase